ncbi:MAG: hypothetical protein HYV95_02000 [Opitutae bacterium]|nr:hypothetical protein [Opitutae bacterium]
MLAVKKTRKGIKADALKLVRELPANASWDDLMYRVYVRQKIDAGLADIRAGRTVLHASVRKEFASHT